VLSWDEATEGQYCRAVVHQSFGWRANAAMRGGIKEKVRAPAQSGAINLASQIHQQFRCLPKRIASSSEEENNNSWFSQL
jgi:hypothetical protein